MKCPSDTGIKQTQGGENTQLTSHARTLAATRPSRSRACSLLKEVLLPMCQGLPFNVRQSTSTRLRPTAWSRSEAALSSCHARARHLRPRRHVLDPRRPSHRFRRLGKAATPTGHCVSLTARAWLAGCLRTQPRSQPGHFLHAANHLGINFGCSSRRW